MLRYRVGYLVEGVYTNFIIFWHLNLETKKIIGRTAVTDPLVIISKFTDPCVCKAENINIILITLIYSHGTFK